MLEVSKSAELPSLSQEGSMIETAVEIVRGWFRSALVKNAF
jgi:hypothetical protein